MDLGLGDKVVFITGASGGIGRALAEAFGAEGCRLLLTGHSRADELAAWCADQPFADRALTAPADVRDPAALEAAATLAVERFGRLDACVANAGVWPPGDLGLHELPPERLRATVETNLLGALWTARAFLGALARSGPRSDGHGASLAFIGSTAGRFGERGHVDYAASKAGLTGAVLVMIAHGLLVALAFGLSGHLYRQTGSLDMSRMGGLLRQMPLAGSALLMALFAGCGLPGFANFAGEVMIFFAAWSAGFKTITVIAAWSALVIGGLYMMRAIRNILHGPRGGDWAKASDVSPLIATALGLLLAALLVFGFAPWLLTKGIEGEVTEIVRLAKPAAAASQAQATEAAGR